MSITEYKEQAEKIRESHQRELDLLNRAFAMENTKYRIGKVYKSCGTYTLIESVNVKYRGEFRELVVTAQGHRCLPNGKLVENGEKLIWNTPFAYDEQ